MNRDRNIPTWFCGQKQNAPGEKRHLLFTTQWCFFSFARTPVWGHPSKPQQEALVQEKNYPTKGVNRNSSKLFKKAPSPLGVTMIGWWPLFVPAHSACSLIPLLRVVRSVGMLWVKSSREAKASRSKGGLRVSATLRPSCMEPRRTMTKQRGHLTGLTTPSRKTTDN